MKERTDSEETLSPSSKYPHITSHVNHWHRLSPSGIITPDVLDSEYKGSGTESDPYEISFVENDPGDPKQFPQSTKWMIVAGVSSVFFVSAISSSIFVGTINSVEEDFGVVEEVALLGLSLFLLGLAFGPMLWAPLGELYGRQVTQCSTYILFIAFNGGVTAAQNFQTVLICRFFAGLFASAPYINCNGNLADIFDPAKRGLAFGFYAAVPFMGPVLGPVVGGFLGTAAGWRWVMGLTTILSAAGWIAGILMIPETFGAVILRRRAQALSRLTGDHYISKIEAMQGPTSAKQVFKKAIFRPWGILVFDPIVFFLSTYMSLVYGTLYMFLAAFPYVYHDTRGWSPGMTGVALLGIGVGTILASIVNIPISRRFAKKASQGNGQPEVRLQPAIFGAIFITGGLFWFAWTCQPSIPWPSSVVAGGFFGFGMVVVWTSISNYLVDAYKVYAASAMAGQVVWRSIYAAAFPLFTGPMYRGLGLNWASSVPAFVALACTPMPLVFYLYGERIRARSRYAPKVEAATKALNESSKS